MVDSSPQRIRLWSVSFAGALLAVLGVAVVLLGFPTDQDLSESDFSQDWVSGAALLDGIDPYLEYGKLLDHYLGEETKAFPIGHRNPHTPAQIILMSPLSQLDYEDARAIWYLLSVGACFTAVYIVGRSLGWGRPAAGIVGVLGLVTVPMLEDLNHGQVNGFVLLLLVLGWKSLRESHHVRAGVFLGVASSIRIFPLLLVIYLVRNERGRVALWQLASASIALLLAAVVIGFDSVGTFLFDAAPTNSDYWLESPWNLSLVATPFRWLTVNEWRAGGTDQLVPAVVLAACVLALCFVGIALTRAALSGDRFWGALPWMLLASPLSWDHYLVLVLPLVLLIAETCRRRSEVPPLVVALSVAVVVTGLPPWVSRLSYFEINDLHLLAGFVVPTLALLILGAYDWAPWEQGASRTRPRQMST